MNQLLLFLFLLGCFTQNKTFNESSNDQQIEISQSLALTWFTDYIEDISHEQIREILQIIVLTHHLIQCSLDMTYHKLNLQKSALNLYSPSITDSLHSPFHMRTNDLSDMYASLKIFEENQQKVQAVCKQIQKVGPHIITLQPKMTQQFIDNIKTILISWSAHQQESVTVFVGARDSLKKIALSIAHVTKYYQNMINADSLPHSEIQLFASTVSQNYHELEQTFLSWLILNKNRALVLKKILAVAFKEHFTVLYKQLSQQDKNLFLEEIVSLDIDITELSFIA